jgi:hypothetical protein
MLPTLQIINLEDTERAKIVSDSIYQFYNYVASDEIREIDYTTYVELVKEHIDGNLLLRLSLGDSVAVCALSTPMLDQHSKGLGCYINLFAAWGTDRTLATKLMRFVLKYAKDSNLSWVLTTKRIDKHTYIYKYKQVR